MYQIYLPNFCCTHCRFLLVFASLPGSSSCQLSNWALIMLEAALRFGSCIVVGGTKCQQQAHEPWHFAFEALVQSNQIILSTNNMAASVLLIPFVLFSLQVHRLGRETLQQQCLLKPSLYKIEASCSKLQACKAVQR